MVILLNNLFHCHVFKGVWFLKWGESIGTFYRPAYYTTNAILVAVVVTLNTIACCISLGFVLLLFQIILMVLPDFYTVLLTCACIHIYIISRLIFVIKNYQVAHWEWSKEIIVNKGAIVCLYCGARLWEIEGKQRSFLIYIYYYCSCCFLLQLEKGNPQLRRAFYTNNTQTRIMSFSRSCTYCP